LKTKQLILKHLTLSILLLFSVLIIAQDEYIMNGMGIQDETTILDTSRLENGLIQPIKLCIQHEK